MGANNHGAVAAGHELTARAAASALREGGNAFDAAVAGLAASCVAEPILSSPGGGGFAMVRPANGPVRLIDFFPHTPLYSPNRNDGQASGQWQVLADFGTTTQAFHIGPATVATPGFAHGVTALHALGSGLSLSDLFAPATGWARSGVTVSDFQGYLMTVVEPILSATPEALRLFAPAGRLLQAGELLLNPDLADALDHLAKGEAVNSGLVDAILETQSDHGHLTPDDFSRYRAIDRKPMTVRFGEATIHVNPPPAAGGVLIAHSLSRVSNAAPTGLATAFRATSLERTQLLDRAIRQKGTTHISVIDANGNACAVTVSNGEGNGQIVPGFGFMPNNILGEEDVNPYGSEWPFDRRLASMMCPTIIERADGSITALGSGGSNRIRTALAQVLTHLCLSDSDLATAIRAPRLHVDGPLDNLHLDFEDFFSSDERKALVSAFPNHRPWSETNMFYGGVHAVTRTTQGMTTAVGDVRRDGAAVVVGT